MAEATATTAAPAAGAAGAADPKAAGAAAAGTNGTAKPAEAEGTQEFIVNGKPVRLSPAQIKVAVQKGLFADGTLKSVDVLKKSSAALIDALKTPEGVIKLLQDKSLGNSPKAVLKALLASGQIDDETKEDLSKWVYDNVVAQAKKTPEQIETEKQLAELAKLKKDKADEETRKLSQQQQGQVNQIHQAIRSEVTKQILADKTFPQTEGSIRAVVEKLRVMNKKGVPVTVENITKALGLVKKDHVLHQQAMLDAIEDPEGLIALVGEERALKISRALVARLKNKEKLKVGEAKSKDEAGREKTTDRIDRKLGKTPQGYTILDI